MGRDKAVLQLDGVPMAERIARLLSERCERVTVLGRTPIEGFDFFSDAEEFGGPLAAVSRFEPVAEFVFWAACDLPLFEIGVFDVLRAEIGEQDAAVPIIEDRLQPFCALYKRNAILKSRLVVEGGGRSAMAWLDLLHVVAVRGEIFIGANVNPLAVRGANTPTEFQSLLDSRD